MKKKRYIIITLVITVICISIILIVKSSMGQKPFKDISYGEIESVTVELYPPDIKATLAEAEIKDLVDILQDVIIYKQDNSYTEYDGQAVIYRIIKADDTVIEIQAYNPFLIINGTGYKTKYEPCEELNHLGNIIGDIN